MAIGMFSSQVSPIAIDFGTSVVKVLQVAPGEPPALVAAAQIEIPDAARLDMNKRHDFLAEELPKTLRKGKFKGKKVACSIPSSRTFVQHLQVPTVGPVIGDEFINGQLSALIGLPPNNMVIRTVSVADLVKPDGGTRQETICFAVPRDVVMKQIDMLRRCKLEVTGVHTEQHAIIWAFNHLHRRQGDDQFTNLIIDLGWGSTKVGISHGARLMFAKSIPIGGRHYDQHIADTLHCDLASARAHREATMEAVAPVRPAAARTGSAILDRGLSSAAESGARGGSAIATDRRSGSLPAALVPAGEDNDVPPAPRGVDFTELNESIVDEIRMCLRYHRALFESRKVDRAIFVGAGSRNTPMCRMIAKRINAPALLGDPMARVKKDGSASVIDVRPDDVLPGWTVACGLCSGAES
jgi:type IV pilus assembly protein PilM